MSEATTEKVKDITKGGDILDAVPFASGLNGPSSILPLSSGEILISEMWGDSISDIHKGGDFSKTQRWCSGLSGPYSLVAIDCMGVTKLYVTEGFNGRDSWVSEINEQGKVGARYIDGIPVTPVYVGMTPLHS